MSAAEIMQEVRKLPEAEALALARMIDEFEAEIWDRKMDADAASGALDFLFDEADAERQAGTLREWPQP